MSNEVIGNCIRQLHKTLDGASTISEKDRDQLKELSADLQEVLARTGAASREKHQTLVDRLRDSVTRFEASHPDLTATMSQASKVLADMGI